MTLYELRKLLRRAKGTEILLPAIEESAASRVTYLKVLRAMLREIAREARQVMSVSALQALASTALRLGLSAEQMVSNILRLEARRHTETFKASVKRTMGIDLAAVVREEDLTDYLQKAALRNASLIKGLSETTVARVQNTVTTALINGQSARELSKALTEDFGIADRRAQLIAQDQMAKLNSDLNRIRHEQAGVHEYKWLTSRDERVRPRHKALEGKVYRYGQPTGAEDGLPPGQPIRCRCVARGIVQF